jgi:hypothetical protein
VCGYLYINKQEMLLSQLVPLSAVFHLVLNLGFITSLQNYVPKVIYPREKKVEVAHFLTTNLSAGSFYS